jgi:hypothetical protein
VAAVLSGNLPKPAARDGGRYTLFYNLERGALAMTCGRAGQQRPNGLNCLTISTDNSADVALTKLHPENRGFATGNLGQHHLVWKLNQLTNHEFEKFLHVGETVAALYERR